MLFYKNQLYRHHKKEFDLVDIKCGDVTLETTETMKVLGITFNEHLDWTSHINKIAIECFSTLRKLRLLKRFPPFKIRKELVQTLILSKVDYGNIVFNPILKTLQSHLQKVMNAAAGFVWNRHSKENDCIKLSWLPIEERLEYSAAAVAFKGVFEMVPANMKLQLAKDTRALRSNRENIGPTIQRSSIANSNSNIVARTFNGLPKPIRDSKTLNSFKTKTFTCLMDKAIARTL